VHFASRSADLAWLFFFPVLLGDVGGLGLVSWLFLLLGVFSSFGWAWGCYLFAQQLILHLPSTRPLFTWFPRCPSLSIEAITSWESLQFTVLARLAKYFSVISGCDFGLLFLGGGSWLDEFCVWFEGLVRWNGCPWKTLPTRQREFCRMFRDLFVGMGVGTNVLASSTGFAFNGPFNLLLLGWV